MLDMLHEPFGEHSLSQTVVFEWHSCCRAGWVSVEDDECSVWPSTSKMTENAEKIWELIHVDRRWTMHELLDTAGISYGVCQEILTENLSMRRISKWSKAAVCKCVIELQEKANKDPTFMNISRIIMGDKSWIYGYDPETNKNCHTGRAHNHQEQKRHGRSRVQQRACSLFFLTWHDCSVWICSS
jgi:hypothetical protein